MSLAIYAAPFDNDNNIQVKNGENDTPIGRKRNANNKTQKRFPKENGYYSDKVNSVLQTIHNMPENYDNLSDFVPMPPPTSVGVEQTRIRENTPDNKNASSYLDQQGINDVPNNYDLNKLQDTNINDKDYYKRFMPNYDNMYKTSPHNLPYYSGASSSSSAAASHNIGSTNDVLIEKLNYMINLLEQQQDDKTNNVTEEVILYCFLGIFIIFIVDSFARVGKYVR
jgi:hypothetical protein